MFFKFERRYNLLTVEDNFAHLKSIESNGDLTFEFSYRVSQKDVVQRDAMTCRVTVISRHITRIPILATSHTGKIDTKRLIHNVLTLMPQAKAAVKQQQEFVIAHKMSDISARINNEVVGQLRSPLPTNRIQQLIKPVLKMVPAGSLKQDNVTKPVLNMTAHTTLQDLTTVVSASHAAVPQYLMHDMIVRQGIDPTHIFNLTHRTIPAKSVVGGLLRPSRAFEVEHSPAVRLLNSHIFHPETPQQPPTTEQVEDSALVQVLTHETVDHVHVPVEVIVPRNRRSLDGKDNSHFFVKFELLNGRTGLAIDTILKPLDISRHIQLFYTPRRPPRVQVAKSELSGRVNLEIKQIDPGATAVQVFKKTFYRAVTDVDDYSLIGTYNLRSDQQSLLVQIDKPQHSPAIYRVVPVGSQGNLGFEFTNIVVRPNRYTPIKALSLTAQSIDVGVRVEARSIPQHVVAIEFLARNKTTFESDYRNVGEDVLLVDDTARAADHLVVVDRAVTLNNIFEYAARLIYRDGHSEQAGSAIVEFIQQTPGKVDTRVENVQVNHSSIDANADGQVDTNVTFNMSTEVIDNSHDVIKALLQRQDIYDLFKDDVQREREFLKSLIAHNVQRVDLTTGRREDFGVLTGDFFDDNARRKNLAIQPLQLGHRYRYEVTALLRAPETMFETLSKEKVDSVTKKVFAFNPAKFMHPIALSRGVLVTSAGLRTRYAKEAMSHGAIGSTKSVEVSFDEDLCRILDPAASRFDRHLNVLTWKIQGSIDSVDHFLIMKEVNGHRTLIGKAHSEFPHNSCQYLHPISHRDHGHVVYVITPIYNSYKTGASAKTNAVLLDDV